MPFLITGAKETAAALTKLGNTIAGQILPESVKEICDLLVEKAQGNAAVDTGFMRDNIKIAEVSETTGIVRSEADYSIYVEEGTSRMGSQPFMQPALAEAEREAPALVKKKVTAAISQTFR